VYVSLVDARESPYRSDLRQLSVETICTNRDLPLFVPVGRGETDFTLDTGAPVGAIRCVSGVPTAPRASHAEGEHAWRAVSHLSLNYLSIADENPAKASAALRDLLKLYADASDPAIRQQIQGVVSVSTKPVTRRAPIPGPISFARGLEITVQLDDSLFEGSGVFLLGAVLEQFFARYVSINSFTETVIRTQDRAEVMRWPARIGHKQML
jgi:type VI secretion system protein ImpG